MKKILLLTGLILSSLTAVATDSFMNSDTALVQNYNREQTVIAYYVSGGQLVRLKIRTNGSQVTAYSTGKDFVGQETWHFVPNANIRETNASFDGQLAREFDYTATISISNGYQSSSVKIYF